MSKQSKRRRDAKRAKEAKTRRRATASRRADSSFAAASNMFGDDPVDVTVIRSQSGKVYRDGENIPLDDRIVMHRQSVSSIKQAIPIADQFRADVAAGKYPPGSRVTIMDSAWQVG